MYALPVSVAEGGGGEIGNLLFTCLQFFAYVICILLQVVMNIYIKSRIYANIQDKCIFAFHCRSSALNCAIYHTSLMQISDGLFKAEKIC